MQGFEPGLDKIDVLFLSIFLSIYFTKICV